MAKPSGMALGTQSSSFLFSIKRQIPYLFLVLYRRTFGSFGSDLKIISILNKGTQNSREPQVRVSQ